MNLTWDEIKKLKGEKLKEKSTCRVYEVKSINSNFIRIGGENGGIKIITSIFYETRQKDWEIVNK